MTCLTSFTDTNGWNIGQTLATTFLSFATGQAQELCSAQMCISATIFSADINTIEFSLFSKIPVGWVGLGMGGSSTSMVGNDLAVSSLIFLPFSV